MDNKAVILVVEDETVISNILMAKLKTMGYRPIPAYTGKEATSLAASHCPDLVLLDLGLPDIDGMEVLASIRRWSSVPIVVLSARQRDEDIVQALDNGADDYITKPFNNAILMARIRNALRKHPIWKADQNQMRQSFQNGSLIIDYDKRIVTVDGQEVHLTPAEYKMLAFLARNAGKVVTYSAICKELWGPYVGDKRTLRVNMANLRRKIESNSADPRFILTEIGVGYRMIDSDEPENDKEPNLP